MNAKYMVEELKDRSELKAVKDVWEKYFSEVFYPNFGLTYDWYYNCCPVKNGKVWLLRKASDNKIVGVSGLIYRNFIIKGMRRIGGLGVHTYIDEKHRVLGPALMLQRKVIEYAEKTADFYYGFPSDKAEAMLKFMKLKKIGEFNRYTKYNDIPNFLESGIPSGLSNVIIRLTEIPYRFANTILSQFHINKNYRSFRTKNVAHIIPFLNEFHKNHIDGGERDKTFLKWRYLDNSMKKFEIFYICNPSADNRIEGLIIYRWNRLEIQIYDLLMLDMNDKKLFKNLICNFERYFLKRASKIYLAVIDLGYGIKYGEWLKELGYIPKKAIGSVWFKTDNDEVAQALIGTEHTLWINLSEG